MSVRQSELIVDLSSVEHNLKTLQKKLTNNSSLMPIIKANAYGLGVKKLLEIINKLNISQVAVAIVDEGIFLRELGYKGMIFILNQPFVEEIESIINYNLTPGISTNTFVEALGEFLQEPLNIHIEIGSGMGRTGIHPNRTEEFINKIQNYKNIKIDGLYTHFSCSDCDYDYTKKQIDNFNFSIQVAKNKLGNINYIHACNSAGIVSFPEAHYSLVRPGIMIYGYLPDESLKGKIDLKPSVKLKSKIAYIKEVPKDTSIGYGRTFITNKTTKIATIPLGYADGLPRILSNNGCVVINGNIVPIIGRVCMDSFMADITNIENINIGDEVFIWDNSNILLEDVANKCNTINYEILSTISYRVPRKYVNEK